MKNIFYVITVLMLSFQTSRADQNDPIECVVYIYHPQLTGSLGDITEDNKIEIIRRYTGAVYSASYSPTVNGVEVHLRFNEGSYFSGKSGLINSEIPQFSMAIADTSFLCRLK